MTATDRSGNEIYGLAFKAGRGAGVPVGQAEFMARILSIHADAEVVAAFLDHLDRPARLAVVTTGDGLHIAHAHLFRDGPLVVDALNGGALEATLTPMAPCPCVKSLAYANGLDVRSDGSGGVTFTKGTNTAQTMPNRATIDDELWRRLNRWASKTYVPETDASRLSGAGAGLTDND